MPNYGRLECGTVPNHLYIHSSRSVPSIHICRLAFSKQMLREIGSLVQNARCPYFSEERDKPSTYENVKNTPNYNVQMRPST